MDFSLEQMPDNSRLWIYQADRKFTKEEVAFIHAETKAFLTHWSAHGTQLKVAYELLYDQILIISVDEGVHGASGCSIDDSVNLVRSFEKKLSVSMLDKSSVAFLNNGELACIAISSLKKAVADNEVLMDSIVLNNAVSNYGDFKRSWKQPADQSWLKRYFA
jgi:hypothetical protein